MILRTSAKPTGHIIDGAKVQSGGLFRPTEAISIHDLHKLSTAGRNAIALFEFDVFVTGLAIAAAIIVNVNFREI